MPASARRDRPRKVDVRAWLALAALAAAGGCAGPDGAGAPGSSSGWSRGLLELGLEPLGEEEARIPAAERGRYVPCRVIPGFPAPALEPHPAGYLIAGAGDALLDASATRRALAAWSPGETLVLKVRRNPYAQPDAEWWEAEVRLRRP
jgi:hypothetical protein